MSMINLLWFQLYLIYGRNSIDVDSSSILASINTMDNQIKEATFIKNNSSKMYRVLGVTSGLIIVIFFI